MRIASVLAAQIAVLSVSLASRIANAEPAIPWPRLNLSVGGGVVDFSDDAARHLTKLGAIWDVRALLGENTPVGVELAYVGTAHGLNNVMQRFAADGTILSNAFEGAVRFQVPAALSAIRPFLLVGVGWNQFELVSESFRDPSAIKNSDDTLVLPFGAGVQLDLATHLTLDGRFTYRAMLEERFLYTSASGLPGVGSQDLSQWAASARVGYTF
jgi:opacity protein-like surface antigen